MRVAVASMGTVPEALVGVRFGMCSQFLVFELDTMEYVVLSVPARQEDQDRVSLAAIRAVAKQDVSAVITGHIKEVCCETLLGLGIDVIDGVEGMTVLDAIERYKSTGLQTPGSRKGVINRIAVVSSGEGLGGRLEIPLNICTAFVVVDPATNAWEIVRSEPNGSSREVSLNAIRTIVRSGAGVVIAPEIHPECCMALQALAVAVYLAPAGITVREAIGMYEGGQLKESTYAF
jgi:predicted Fe-Mo cluster-binding NifX family protein